MKKTAIICEYNLFHRGHARQIEAIRSRDPETCLIAVMSGSFVQRGEIAVRPAHERAETAVRCGADLVAELPYPWSGAGANGFAHGGVSVAAALGADTLCFGSESGDEAGLSRAAARLADGTFEAALAEALAAAPADRPYRVTRDETYRLLYGEDLPSGPNDTLALAYLAELRDTDLVPFVLHRTGSESASRTRELYRAGQWEALSELVPPVIAEHCRTRPPYDIERAAAALLDFYRFGTVRPDAAELAGGLDGRLIAAANEAGTVSEWYRLAATKKYTDARVRRASLFGYFGVTPEKLKAAPRFTRILAMTKRGAAALSELRREETAFHILTKPAAGKALVGEAGEQFALAVRADAFYSLCAPTPEERHAADILRRTPFISEE